MRLEKETSRGIMGSQGTESGSETETFRQESGTDVSEAPGSASGSRCRSSGTAPSARQRFLRRRRLAALTIAVALGIACRWEVANRAPSYPVGEGVYQRKTETGNQPNAAVFYMAAADAYHVTLPAGLENGTHGLIAAPLSLQKPAIAQAQPAFALLRQGMRYRFAPDTNINFFAVPDPRGEGPLQPRDFSPLREMARMLAVESRVKAASGDNYGALQSSLDAVRLGIDCGQGDSLTAGMVGVLLQCIGVSEGVRHVAGLSGSEARAAATRLEPMLERERTFAQIMTAERDTSTYAMLERVFETGTLRGLNSSTGEEFDLQGTPWTFAAGAVVFARTKQGVVNDFARQYDRILARVKLPYHLAAHQTPVEASANPLVRHWLTEEFDRAFSQTVRQSARNRVLLTRLAIQAYRREHGGTAPESLIALTRGKTPYLHALPSDPFSPIPGSSLRYNACTGTAFTVGENGVDEGNGGDDNLELYNQ